VFKGLKSLTGRDYVERTVIKAIKNDIAIYAIHTNLDHVQHGVNKRIWDRLGLINTRILAPKPSLLMKLTTIIPIEQTDQVMQALDQAGAGEIGNYSSCSFQVAGTGTFMPSEEANPTIGRRGELERVAEHRVEVIVPSHLKNKVLHSLRQAHPYEEVAYYLQSLDNANQEVGAGMVGELENAMGEVDFLLYLKKRMDLKVLKHTALSGYH